MKRTETRLSDREEHIVETEGQVCWRVKKHWREQGWKELAEARRRFTQASWTKLEVSEKKLSELKQAQERVLREYKLPGYQLRELQSW